MARRGYRLDPDYVISRRLGTADTDPAKSVIDGADSWGRSVALLGGTDITADAPAARRMVLEYVEREFGGDGEVFAELTEALGLGGEAG